MRAFLICLLIAISLGSCIDPFEPEVGNYNSTLVIDGLFSDSESPSQILLSESFPYSERAGRPVSGAEVIIEEEQGPFHKLQEVSKGRYITDPATFQGKAGRRYRLVVRTVDRDAFESDWELLKPSPPIGEIKTQYEEQIPDNPDFNPIPGVRFLVSTQDLENNTHFYRWEFEETYQYLLPYPPNIKVTFGAVPGRGNDQVEFITGEEFEGSKCWKTDTSAQILIASTENLTEDIIEDFPLHYISNKSPKLYVKVSLLVKQYALSKNYYEFLDKLKQINQTTGSLFDPIPNEVFGNIRSVGSQDIPVLGYFGVAGVKEQRIFVDKSELPGNIAVPAGPSCILDTIDLHFGTLYSRTRSGTHVLFNYSLNLLGDPNGFILTWPVCTSCAASGATNKEPDFW